MPVHMNFTIRKVTESDRDWVLRVVQGWGADFIVTQGRTVYPVNLPGFLASDASGAPVGLATYELIGDQCELVTLDAFHKFSGMGTGLLKAVEDEARRVGCRRLWLITLNDNLDAIRFYQRRGMTIAAVHTNAMELSRKIKPAIPEVGQHNIPLRDEIEFEMQL